MKGLLNFSRQSNQQKRAYATKSHRFLFLPRFVHSFRLRFIHNGGYQQFRFMSGLSPAKTYTLALCIIAPVGIKAFVRFHLRCRSQALIILRRHSTAALNAQHN